MKERIRSTTVLCVRRENKVVMAGDGQVTLGNEVIKASAHKVRRLYNDKIVAGFAGSTADAFALFARFESKLEQFNGNLSRAAAELAKDWRTNRMLRHLEALLLRQCVLGWQRTGAPTACCAILKRYCWWPTTRTPTSSAATATSSSRTRAPRPSAPAGLSRSPPPPGW